MFIILMFIPLYTDHTPHTSPPDRVQHSLLRNSITRFEHPGKLLRTFKLNFYV
ncbi:MAG: hypothetical protein F6K22_00955 [Okeania sp. SIO2F4]|nr:hypothetical protein [Okeania sp. SIO2F4]